MLPYKYLLRILAFWRKALLFFIWAGAPFCLLAQLSPADSSTVKRLENLAYQHFLSDFDKAIYYLDAMAKKSSELCHWEGVAEAYILKITCSRMHEKMQLTRVYLKKMDSFLSAYKNKLGVSFEKYNIDNKTHWAGYFDDLGRSDTALEMYHRLYVEIMDKTEKTSSDWSQLFLVSQNMAGINSGKGNYEQAIGLFLKCVDYNNRGKEMKNEPPSPLTAAIIYQNIGDILVVKGDAEQAKSYYGKAIAKLDASFAFYGKSKERGMVNQWAGVIYISAGKLFREMGDFEKAFRYFEKALFYKKEDATHRHRIFSEYGMTYLAKGDYEKALEYFNKCLEQNRKGDYANQTDLATTYINIGQVFFQKEDYGEALSYFQKALTNLADDFESDDFDDNPSLDRVFSRQILLKTLHWKSEALWYLSRNEPGIQKYTGAALDAATLAVDLMDSIKTDFTSEADKQFLVELSYPIFERAIKLSLETKGDFRKNAFLMAEKSKSIVLLEALRNSRAKAIAGMPEELLEKVFELKTQIAHWEELIFREKTGREDEAIINGYRKEIFALKEAHQKLILQFEKENPTYYRLKHNSPLVSVEDVQQMLYPNQSLLEYFVGDSSLFVFLIKKEVIKVVEINRSFDLNGLVKKMLDGIYTCPILGCPNEEVYFEMSLKYVESAVQLYEHLLLPFEKEITGNLIIIPDGILGYLPFGALLSKKPKVATNFKTHDYLQRAHTISYANSAGLLREMRQNHTKTSSRNLLAVAPEFEEYRPIALRGATTGQRSIIKETPGLIGAADKLRDIRNGLSPLKFNIPEATDIAKLFRGDLLAAGEATLDKFRQLAGNYRILHLATHAKANDEEGDFSFLALKAADGIHNDSLFVKDIYNLHLQADMVVLSACETGIGELQRGEGIISLARGFSYAGAKSIITTLWSVGDETSLKIMHSFYRNLETGLRKDAALQKAQLAYLNDKKRSHRTAHPFYWAGYVAIGNMEPLPFYSASFWWWCLGGLLVASAFLMMKRRFRS